MIPELCNIIYKKYVSSLLWFPIWTPRSRKKKEPTLQQLPKLRIIESLLFPPECVGSGQDAQFCLLPHPSLLPSTPQASGSQACWITPNPNAHVTSHCGTQGAANRSLSTRSSHTRDVSHPLGGFKELTPLPEVSFSPWVDLSHGSMRLALNGGMWCVVTKLGMDPRTPVQSGALAWHCPP